MSDARTFKVLFVTTLFEVIAFAVIIPILPLLLTEPSSSLFILPERYSVDFGLVLLGAITAAYPFGQFLSTPILGELSDRYGRRPLLMMSIAGTVGANIVFGYGVMTASMPLLLGAKLFDGLTGGNISVVQAAVADISSNEEKSERFSKLGAAFGVGLALGPAIAGVLSTASLASFLSPSTPFFFASALSLVSFSLVYFVLRETSPMEVSNEDMLEPFRRIGFYLFRSDVRGLFFANLLYFVGFAFFTTFVSDIVSNRFGLNQLQLGGYYLLIGTTVIGSRFFAVPKIFEGREERSLVVPGLVSTAAMLFLLYLVDSSLPLYIFTTGGFALANSVTQVAIQSSVSIGSQEDEQGTALGIYSSMRALGQSIPGITAGVVVAALATDIAFVLAGGTVLSTALLFWLTDRNQ